MSESEQGLKVVDAFDLDDELRSILRPGEMTKDAKGRRHRLPRYFYEIATHDSAVAVRLTANFGINEFTLVDLKEHPRLQRFPRYIPCAVRVLAFVLQRYREQLGLSLHVAVNGGYRSPAHKLAASGTPHMWGTAADIYKIGTSILHDRETIEKFNRVAEELSDDLYVMPYGHEVGRADDHLHIDLGYLTLVPREINEDRMEMPQAQPRFAFEDRRGNNRRTDDPGRSGDASVSTGNRREVTPVQRSDQERGDGSSQVEARSSVTAETTPLDSAADEAGEAAETLE